MAKKVLKFGGTSVGSIERIVHAANIVKKEHLKKQDNSCCFCNVRKNK